MALVYSSSAQALPVRNVTHILGESSGTAQFIDTGSILATSDIVTSVSDSGDISPTAVVGPQALKDYYQTHQSIGPRGYQGFQGAPGNRGYQGVSGAAGSDYWTTNDPGEWTALGNIYAKYHVTAVDFFQGSDDRLKTDIKEIKGALENIEKIPTFKFKFKGAENDRTHLGTSAQSVLPIIPEVVTKDKKGFMSVTYPELAVYTLAALKELVMILKNNKII